MPVASAVLEASFQLPIREVLQPDVVGHGLGMGLGEGAHGGCPVAAHLLRPVAEPLGALGLIMLGERFEGPVRFEVLSTGGPEGGEARIRPVTRADSSQRPSAPARVPPRSRHARRAWPRADFPLDLPWKQKISRLRTDEAGRTPGSMKRVSRKSRDDGVG